MSYVRLRHPNAGYIQFNRRSSVFHLDWPLIQTLFFLKLSIGGHMLVYVAHTKERWYKFLPSRAVIWATTLTQLSATLLAVSGTFMSPIKLSWALAVWLWALFWMQISELVKVIEEKSSRKTSWTGPTPLPADPAN